jgi:hypothetical protein
MSDPLVHHGRHFGRTVHALCSMHALITNGILRDGERADDPAESFTAECVIYRIPAYHQSNCGRERREHAVYRLLLSMVPGLEERLMNSSEAEIRMISDLVSFGMCLKSILTSYLSMVRSKRGHLVLDRMIPRASKALSWTGSRQEVNL